MKLMFTPDERFQLKFTFDEFMTRKDISMSEKDASVIAEIMKRLSSPRRENKYKKEQVVVMQYIVHQILEAREGIPLDVIEKWDDNEKTSMSMTNNIYLLILDKLNQKLGISTKTLNEIDGVK